MKYFKKLTGDKVYLSPINTEDYPRYTEWMNDISITAYMEQACRIFTLSAEKEFLEKMAGDMNNINLAIINSEDDELLGNISLMEVNKLNGTAELGIFIGNKECQSRGYGTEAIQLICEFAFRLLNMKNIMLRVFDFNPRAKRAYEKAGFREFGRRKDSLFYDGKQRDTIYMELTPELCTTNFLDKELPS
jgi:RimJ/RimL family protein N-acetyltransferase